MFEEAVEYKSLHCWGNPQQIPGTWQTTHQSPTLTPSAAYSNVWLKINYKSTLLCHQTSTPSLLSTETVVTKAMNGLLSAIDRCKPSLLLSLDISAALDTFDHIRHTRLLQGASQLFGLDDHVLSWLKSYLTGRSSYVALEIVTHNCVLQYWCSARLHSRAFAFLNFTTSVGRLISIL